MGVVSEGSDSDVVNEIGDHESAELPPEFRGNAIREIRRHWVDRAARAKGIDPSTVNRALVIGNTVSAEVRVGEDVRGLVYLQSGRIGDLESARAFAADDPIVTVIPDLLPDAPFSFFDEDLAYLAFNYQPLRDEAQTHLLAADQFLHSARDLIGRGGFAAAAENLFGAAERATMAILCMSGTPKWGHEKRIQWLSTEGQKSLGLTVEGASVLGKLYKARDYYRYGEETPTLSIVELVQLLPDVEALVNSARQVVKEEG